MNLNEFAKEVHENAKAHGWWETNRPVGETMALIHSEWSEALEEARAGRPMAYQIQSYGIVEGRIEEDTSKWFPASKPEGIAIELLDGCIRILDLFGNCGYQLTYPNITAMIQKTKWSNPLLKRKTPLSEIVAIAHSLTSKSYDAMSAGMNARAGLSPLEALLGVVFYWIQMNGQNPEKLLLLKHEYNKSRPYKHGKKF